MDWDEGEKRGIGLDWPRTVWAGVEGGRDEAGLEDLDWTR